jgi:rhodanese-related sulfurtransferase
MKHSPGFLALVDEAKHNIRHFGIEGYRALAASGERFLLIDVREESEYAAGHAAAAMHLSKGVIERDIEAKVPDKSTTIVLYCGGGYRSALATDALRRMGYTDAISLDGGWRAWQETQLPAEK